MEHRSLSSYFSGFFIGLALSLQHVTRIHVAKEEDYTEKMARSWGISVFCQFPYLNVVSQSKPLPGVRFTLQLFRIIGNLAIIIGTFNIRSISEKNLPHEGLSEKLSIMFINGNSAMHCGGLNEGPRLPSDLSVI